MYYLMIKTHNKTGFKYLCQTRRKDPHAYLGSGTHWKLHLKTHGADITTEVIGQYEDKAMLKEAGIYYSNLHNVVESEEWANLRIEDGDGGDTSKTVGYIAGMKKRRSYFGEGNPNFGKVGVWTGKVGPMKDMKWFTNGIEELLCHDKPEGWDEGRLGLVCQHCNKNVNKSNYTRWHGDSCKHNPNMNASSRYKQRTALNGKLWWNNGVTTTKAKECPGQGWIKGRLPYARSDI